MIVMPENMNSMRIIHITPILLLAFLVGCGFHVSNGNVPEKLNVLKTKFGVEWPTNYNNAQGGSLTDDRGDSDYVIKMEISESNYLSWFQSVTNELHDFGFDVGHIRDPRLDSHFSWWDCYSLPPSQLRLIADGVAGSSPNGTLYAFVFTTNHIATMYIYGSPK